MDETKVLKEQNISLNVCTKMILNNEKVMKSIKACFDLADKSPIKKSEFKATFFHAAQSLANLFNLEINGINVNPTPDYSGLFINDDELISIAQGGYKTQDSTLKIKFSNNLIMSMITLLHELRHAYQYQSILRHNREGLTNFREGLYDAYKHYTSITTDGHSFAELYTRMKYYCNLSENDAFRFSIEAFEKIINKLYTEEDRKRDTTKRLFDNFEIKKKEICDLLTSSRQGLDTVKRLTAEYKDAMKNIIIAINNNDVVAEQYNYEIIRAIFSSEEDVYGYLKERSYPLYVSVMKEMYGEDYVEKKYEFERKNFFNHGFISYMLFSESYLTNIDKSYVKSFTYDLYLASCMVKDKDFGEFESKEYVKSFRKYIFEDLVNEIVTALTTGKELKADVESLMTYLPDLSNYLSNIIKTKYQKLDVDCFYKRDEQGKVIGVEGIPENLARLVKLLNIEDIIVETKNDYLEL